MDQESAAIERLKAYREIASAWVHQYNSHKRRGKEMVVLAAMLEYDIDCWEECEHRTTLKTLRLLLTVARAKDCHSDVKQALRVFMSVAENAAAKPSGMFTFRVSKDVKDDIPF
jgi:hypothetical protein